jgi:cytochrome c553
VTSAVVVLLLGLLSIGRVEAAEPDLEAGRAVVVGGEQAGVTPCFTCHGLDGAGDSAGAFPRMAGQAAFYIYKQLIDYASGSRPNDVMSPIAREMSEQQMTDVAFYYSRQAAPHGPRPEVDPQVLKRGRKIAEDGLEEAHVEGCNLCHGEDGSGDPPLFPYLAGQYALYTELQLRLWKQGVRQNDPLGVMADIAKAMSDDDIRAVALYYEWLRPAGEAADRAAELGALGRGRGGS